MPVRGAALACVLFACAQAPEHPPIARISLMPPAVAAHDDFQTAVTLDGTASSTFDDPEAPLVFAWHFLDDDAQTSDPLDAPVLTAEFRGSHPPRIQLVVTDGAGHRGEVERSLELTVP